MVTIGELFQNERNQYLIFLGLSLVILGFTTTLYLTDDRFFHRFFGSINPLLMMLLTVIVGLLFLSFLLTRGFSIYQKGNLAGLLIAAAFAVLFGIVIILVDLSAPLAEDINAPFPQSLLFYPTMGFVVEALFHVMLLSVLLFLLTPLTNSFENNQVVWAAILFVALVEPVYQTVLGSERPYPLWPDLYIALHIFLINLCQLALFKRYDFISMYTFRLVYYAIWHIAWGHLRLSFLF